MVDVDKDDSESLLESYPGHRYLTKDLSLVEAFIRSQSKSEIEVNDLLLDIRTSNQLLLSATEYIDQSDGSADIYSLGVLLYEMVTGLPFQASTIQAANVDEVYDPVLSETENIGQCDGELESVYSGKPECRDPLIQELIDTLFQEGNSRGIDLNVTRSESGKFISYPAGSFTLAIQPRKKALLMTVYGQPDQFNEVRQSLVVSADRRPYSKFHVRNLDDIKPAVDMIEVSAVLRQLRRRRNDVELAPAAPRSIRPISGTTSFFAVPAGLGSNALIGQQIKTLKPNNCLVAFELEAVVQQFKRRMYGEFNLIFQNLADWDNKPDIDTSNHPLLLATTHGSFKTLLDGDLYKTLISDPGKSIWDLVVIADFDLLTEDEVWWDKTGQTRIGDVGLINHLLLPISVTKFVDEVSMRPVRKLFNIRQRAMNTIDALPRGERKREVDDIVKTRHEAMHFLVKSRLLPYWDSTDMQVLFQKITYSDGRYNLGPKQVEESMAAFIEVLNLDSKEMSDSVRHEVRRAI